MDLCLILRACSLICVASLSRQPRRRLYVVGEFSEVRLTRFLRSSAHSLLGHQGDGVHLHQEVGMRKTRDKHPRDGWRAGRLGPSVLKRGEGGLQRLALHYIDVPLDDVLWSRTASLKCDAQVS